MSCCKMCGHPVAMSSVSTWTTCTDLDMQTTLGGSPEKQWSENHLGSQHQGLHAQTEIKKKFLALLVFLYHLAIRPQFASLAQVTTGFLPNHQQQYNYTHYIKETCWDDLLLAFLPMSPFFRPGRSLVTSTCKDTALGPLFTQRTQHVLYSSLPCSKPLLHWTSPVNFRKSLPGSRLTQPPFLPPSSVTAWAKSWVFFRCFLPQSTYFDSCSHHLSVRLHRCF